MKCDRNHEYGSAQPWSHLDQIPACFDACQQPTVQYVSADVIAWSVSTHISQLGASDQVSSLPIVSLRLLAVHLYNHCCRTCQPWSTLW